MVSVIINLLMGQIRPAGLAGSNLMEGVAMPFGVAATELARQEAECPGSCACISAWAPNTYQHERPSSLGISAHA
jgi:hypothetical protein